MMKFHVSTSSSSLSIKMATTRGSITLPNLNLNLNFPSSPYCSRDPKWSSSSLPLIAAKFVISHRNAVCYAESSAASTVAAETKDDAAAAPEKPKPKPPAKAPAKALPEMMEEDVIPSLRSTLEKQQDIKELELFFEDNKLEGSFLKKGIPYTFWALFPDGNITGPKGFSISSYGTTASNVEPFLVDEKKVTANLLVFRVEKRLAAQGIIPVWTD
ncbi:hypothetical protein L1987_50712 [Smallanthus sonchifolius]|uniref:Uncharacterized protein n=1 Tax=Smallanthus sonchifolius TaxID=185202 RepID=A0ACB9ENX6_9ASTR|nr:hypothetical protein L1987_50712 [Smallanthus sonchifolius]